MFSTYRATIDRDGVVQLDEPVELSRSHRALVTILGPAFRPGVDDVLLMSKAALAEGWSSESEDAAWAHLADLHDIDDRAEQGDAAK